MFEHAVDNVNSIGRRIGHVFLNERPEAGQVGRD